MRFFLVPERINIVVSVSPDLLKVANRLLDVYEGKEQAKVDALTARLKVANVKLAAVVKQNPDPNPND